METFVYYMAVLLLVAADNIIMVKDVIWRFVGEEGSSVWVKEYHNIMSKEAEECKNDDSAGMEPERRVSLAPTGMRCVRTSIYTR